MSVSDILLDAPVYISTDLKRDAREYPLRHRIMMTPVPGVIVARMRDHPSRVRVAAVRALLHRLGLDEVEVTRFLPNRTSRGKGREICVCVPHLETKESGHWVGGTNWEVGEQVGCWRCNLRMAACVRLGVLLYSAFPDLRCQKSDYDPTTKEYYIPLEVFG